MKATIQRCTLGLVLTLVGCATTGGTRTSGGADLFGCEQIPFDGPGPRPVEPREWEPAKAERGYLHIRYFVAKGRVYAVGVPVNDFKSGTPFFVGPMTDIKEPFDPSQAPAMAKRYAEWAAFYKRLARAYGDSRPLALVCPGQDCPITPEGPPPVVLGATSVYSTTPIVSLDSPSDLRLAALDLQGGGATASDAKLLAGPGWTEEVERTLRALFSDTVTRAVCAARILGAPAR
jgi:hypothetical protein